MKLEYVEALVLAHPFIKGFDQVSYCLSDEEVRTVAQGETSETIAKRKPEDIEGKDGAGPVYSTSFFIGLTIEPKQREAKSIPQQYWWSDHFFAAGATGPRRLDISYPTNEFTKMVKMWEKFDEPSMGIVVRHIKRSDCHLVLRIRLLTNTTIAPVFLIMFSKLASALKNNQGSDPGLVE
jgi:poly(A) polymerase